MKEAITVRTAERLETGNCHDCLDTISIGRRSHRMGVVVHMREIRENLKYYGVINASLGVVRFNINNDSPEKAADRIIREFSLEKRQTT